MLPQTPRSPGAASGRAASTDAPEPTYESKAAQSSPTNQVGAGPSGRNVPRAGGASRHFFPPNIDGDRASPPQQRGRDDTWRQPSPHEMAYIRKEARAGLGHSASSLDVPRPAHEAPDTGSDSDLPMSLQRPSPPSSRTPSAEAAGESPDRSPSLGEASLSVRIDAENSRTPSPAGSKSPAARSKSASTMQALTARTREALGGRRETKEHKGDSGSPEPARRNSLMVPGKLERQGGQRDINTSKKPGLFHRMKDAVTSRHAPNTPQNAAARVDAVDAVIRNPVSLAEAGRGMNLVDRTRLNFAADCARFKDANGPRDRSVEFTRIFAKYLATDEQYGMLSLPNIAKTDLQSLRDAWTAHQGEGVPDVPAERLFAMFDDARKCSSDALARAAARAADSRQSSGIKVAAVPHAPARAGMWEQRMASYERDKTGGPVDTGDDGTNYRNLDSVLESSIGRDNLFRCMCRQFSPEGLLFLEFCESVHGAKNKVEAFMQGKETFLSNEKTTQFRMNFAAEELERKLMNAFDDLRATSPDAADYGDKLQTFELELTRAAEENRRLIETNYMRGGQLHALVEGARRGSAS
ncbi:hypothetical protein [Ramlibacter albus]|uniref:Uncharacterized protein n=1 Tax=Ramlibacter albus TaxID=2079448 RepID=A0A923S3D2_9BURK|nr:hypothetical protein [Ramlibacter albus]MBC5766296.1 hypothetical protein [Ramlibacter albus]